MRIIVIVNHLLSSIGFYFDISELGCQCKRMERAYIGIGSNLNDPVVQVKQALSALKNIPCSEWVCASSLYRSQLMGQQNQPDCINAVAIINTQLTPESLLHVLQQIENDQGRVRTQKRFGSRTLDLDIILYGDAVIKTADLTIPHYGMHEREFVLYPLYEIAPDLVLPTGEVLQDLLVQFQKNHIDRPISKLPQSPLLA